MFRALHAKYRPYEEAEAVKECFLPVSFGWESIVFHDCSFWFVIIYLLCSNLLVVQSPQL